MIDFNEQFQRCSKDGKVTFGPERITEAPGGFMVSNRWVEGKRVIRQREVLCGRFGGKCADHNEQCQNFRLRE